jgi:hypothetical protein
MTSIASQPCEHRRLRSVFGFEVNGPVLGAGFVL